MNFEEYFICDFKNGFIFRKLKYKIKKSGFKMLDGYMGIVFKKKHYRLHHIIWCLAYGEFPKNEINHINGIRDDNRLCNLEDITHRNNCNKSKRHRNGNLFGCYYHKKNKNWISQIRINGKIKHLGVFQTDIEAHNSYLKFLSSNEI